MTMRDTPRPSCRASENLPFEFAAGTAGAGSVGGVVRFELSGGGARRLCSLPAAYRVLPRAAATRFTAGAEPVHDAVQQDYREAALLVIQRCFEGYGTTRSRLGVVGHYWIGIMHLPRCPSANAPGKSDL